MDTHRPPRQRPWPARASGEGTGQVRGRRELPPRRGARRARARLGRLAGEPPPLRPVGIAGGAEEGKRLVGWAVLGLLRARGLTFRYLPRGASHPPSLGVFGVTAAAARQLRLPALLSPHLASGRCALAFLTQRLHWGDPFLGERTGFGPGLRQGGSMIGTWDGGWESRARGSFGNQTFTSG